jgi:alkaline phosphatase D
MSGDEGIAAWNSYAEGPLLSGPIVGHVHEGGARVWAQARDTSPLTLSVFRADGSVLAWEASPTRENYLCVVFDIDGLDPEEPFEISLESAHGTTERRRYRTAPPAGARRFTLTFGSCFWDYPNQGLTIFDAIARESPDVFVMAGDNCYYGDADWQSEEAMMLAQLRHRNNDPLRRLLARVPVLGIWDDHDYGPNDSDSSFEGPSLSVFQRVWANASYGTPETPGVFSSVRLGPVELFLLDSRSSRVGQQHIHGEAQLAWLFDALAASAAPVKLIVSGSQVFPEVAARRGWECWKRDAPEELERLLRFIEERDVRGVVFLSGDVHLGYLLRQPARVLADGRRGPELWELTASPLANEPWTEPVLAADDYDRTIVHEVSACNYGVVDIDLDRAGEEIRLALADAQGKRFFVQPIALSSLRVRPARAGLSAVLHTGVAAYFFRGDGYVRADPLTGHALAGYPRDIGRGWPGLGPGKVNAAVRWSEDKAYFFRGNGYWAYDLSRDRALPGYPRYLGRWWPGVWPGGIDAAVVWPNGKAYLFKGHLYVRYDLAEDRVDPGFPQPIAEHWKGLWPGGVDAAVAWPDGKAYFFKGREVLSWDIAADRLDPGGARPIEDRFPGVMGEGD